MEHYLWSLCQVLGDGSSFFPSIRLFWPRDAIGKQDNICYRPLLYRSFRCITQGLSQTSGKIGGCVVIVKITNGPAHLVTGGHPLVQQSNLSPNPANGTSTGWISCANRASVKARIHC